MQINPDPLYRLDWISATAPSEEAIDRVVALNAALKDVIRDLSVMGVTYKQIETEYGIKENAIKQYLFRKSEKPRRTEFLTNLTTAVIDLGIKHGIKKVDALRRISTCGSIALKAVEASLRTKLIRFNRFVLNSPSLSEMAYSTGEEVADISRLDFFCYRKGRSPHMTRLVVEKTRYSFFRDTGALASECFFEEIAGNDGRVIRSGVARMARDAILLVDLDDNHLATTHIKCSRTSRRAYGWTTISAQGKLSFCAEVLVPCTKVSNAALGPIDYNSNERGEELEDFKEEFQKISAQLQGSH